ncbi:leucine-rich repeat protein [Desulfosporosinus sp. Sb-LF]|uniref:leucine-rich repeat protein n=1 Tax=Desulfosporosinus sp. Sb-LF TaxID=2560027 RepID=UPI00107F0836|nr:leucine-rich repeat protein [Desulfosporosinus sp. Sb-LF]TGE31851.1 hypothetical protein E4K68_14235 [Desulfosporosinus sp. Sb-LF]
MIKQFNQFMYLVLSFMLLVIFIVGVPGSASANGSSWTTRSSGSTNSLAGVTYGNSTFVAVGDAGTILTSPDGASWTTRSSGSTNSLAGVTYGNSTFVAVGDAGTILTSPDGASWTTRSSGSTNSLAGVTYGNSTFVAVGDAGTILTSPDGASWTTRSSGSTNSLVGVTYGNSTFVAVGDAGTILTSPDGATWTTRNAITANSLSGVTYGNSTFVAVGAYGADGYTNWYGTILTSPDGATWTTRRSWSEDFFKGVTYGNSTFVAMGYNGVILTSPDGAVWTTRISSSNYYPSGVTYGNNTFVAVSKYGKFLTSLDGATWNWSNTSYPLRGVTCGNSTFVAVGDYGTIIQSVSSYTVTFDSQEGSAVSSINNVTSGSAIIAPTAPTRTGYAFGGWYKESSCINAWDFSTDSVMTDISLYAKWTVNLAVTVNSVVVKTAPTKVAYYAGDTLDLSGLVVSLNKSDSTIQDVALSNFAENNIATIKADGDALILADTAILITVNGKTTSQAITVNVAANVNPDYTYTVTDGEAQITKYTGSGGDVVIPGTLGGAPVTSIGNYAFQFCPLTSISIPQGVTSIGDGAFFYCGWLLTNINIPQGVTNIGWGAFGGCFGLTTINIPQGVTSIGDYAFENCDSLTSISVAVDNLNYESIDGVLYNKAGTSLIACPEGLTSISIPQGVTDISEGAFFGCRSLTSISIPQGVTSISEGTFSSCRGLTSISIPQSVTSIGYQAFYNCDHLTSISIPQSVTSIGWGAFAFCDSLTTLRFNSSTTTISNNDGIDTIPSTTTIIGYDPSTAKDYAAKYNRAFEAIGTTNYSVSIGTLTDGNITANPTLAITGTAINLTITPDEGMQLKAGTLKYNDGTDHVIIGTSFTMPAANVTVTAVFEQKPANDYTYILTASGAQITGYTGAGGDVTIPSALGGLPVTSIGDLAFQDCTGLTSISIPQGVISIGESAFKGCTGLNTIVFNSTTTIIIGASTIPTATKIIGYDPSTAKDYAIKYGRTFEAIDATNILQSITISTPATKLHYTVGDALDITGLVIIGTFNDGSTTPEAITAANITGFDNTVAATDQVLTITVGGKTVTYKVQIVAAPQMPDYSYNVADGKAQITGYTGTGGDVTIPNSLGGFPVTSIGYQAFAYYSILTSVSIPESVTSIGDRAFINCTGLTSITIPQGVTSIGNVTFAGCTGLTTISIPAGVASIGNDVFDGCTGLSAIRFNSATTIIDGSYTIPAATKIIGYVSSTAKDYAAKYNRAFEAIDATNTLLAFVSPQDLPQAVVGTPYSYTFVATGGSGYTFSLPIPAGEPSDYPDGLSISSNGVLSGTPIMGGTWNGIPVTVTDSTGSSITGSFNLTVSNSGGAVTLQHVSAVNGTITLTMSGVDPSWNSTGGPTTSMFLVTMSINGSAPIPVSASYTGGDNVTLYLNVPNIKPVSFNQNVVYSVSYLSEQQMSANTFTVPAAISGTTTLGTIKAYVLNNSVLVGKYLFQRLNTNGLTQANVLEAMATAPGQHIYFKSFNGLWYDLSNNSVTNANDLTDSTKALDETTTIDLLQVLKWFQAADSVTNY